MRGTRKVTEQDILGENAGGGITDMDIKKEVEKVANPYRYKIEFIRYDGDKSKLKPCPVTAKNQKIGEDKDEILERSMFIANYVNGKYKIMYIYKGFNNNIERRFFDGFKKENKLKYKFFKQKGIIF